MSNHKKLLMVFVLCGVLFSAFANAEKVERQPRVYGALRELSMNSDQNPLEMKDGPDKTKLTRKCDDKLAGGLFTLYTFKTGGKQIAVIGDGSESGQNVFSQNFYVIDKNCERLGKVAGRSEVANEPKGTYHMASAMVNSSGDVVYFLVEEKYGPGKICMSPTSCERLKGYSFGRELYKVTDRGFVPQLAARKKMPQDADMDTVIPLGISGGN